MAAVSSMVTAAATAAAVYVLMRPSKQVNSDNVNAATTHAAEDKSSNPALQLPTPDQVGHISRTWALVKDSVGLQKAGELFFHTLFEAHPEALGLFTKFKDEPKWQESATFKEHALRVISTVDTAFGMLGDLDQLVPILQRLGKAHVGYGAQPQHYDWVGAALVGTLQTALGPKMTAEVTEAYVVVYTVVKTVMLGGAAEATAPTHPSVQDLLGPDDHHDHEMPKLDGVTGAAVAIDPKDHDSPDDWVPRRREMIRLTGLHPFNSEPPLSVMMKEGFFTSPGLHYIRNHGAVPNLSWESHTIQLQTDDGTVVHELTMDELAAFPTRTLPITMNCAGNRRKEQNVIKKTKGFSWGAAAVGTSYWTGVLLRDLLLHYGLVTEEEFFKPHPDRLHVCFAGVDELPAGIYGTSIPMSVALDPTRECMIAYKQNGALLTPDHGFPVRTMLPGMIGGRMIKWLGSIRICRTESTDFYHYYDNRVMPPMYDETNITDEVWKDPSYIINDRNLNSAITRPAHNEQISLATARKQKMYTVKGYAYMGAGQRISRVEITLNEGDTWEVCTLYTEEKPTKWGKSWCWVFWSLEVETTRLLQCETLAVRCWDQSTNSQPGKLTWSILGMMNNCWFRVKMKQIGNGNDKTEVRCLHPAVVDGDMKGWMVEEKEALEAPATVLTSAPVADDNAPSYPLEEIAKHSTEDDCWIILHGKVYDTSEFMADHPGGGNSILKVTGTDSSQVFDAIHSQKAHAMLADYEIGVVASSPALQLPTPDQVGHISRTWALVKDSVGLQKAGELFFHTLFEAHPEALGLFTKFKDEPKWQESATFKEHALRVISTVDTAFGMLGDLDQLVPILQRLGKAHVGYGAQPQHYDWVGAALVGTLQTALGPKMTAEVTEAYVVVYTVVKTVMLGGAAEDCPEDGSANDRKDDSASGFTLAQVAAHDKVEDCWTVVHGEVYDITGFMEDHPGGKALLMMYAGKVADEGFDPIHPFSILEEHRNKGVVHLGKLSATEMAKVSASTPADNPAQDVKVLELDQCLNLYDLEHVAKSKMKLSAFNYYATGATDMFTVDGNQEIYRSIRLCPRVMVDVTDTSTTSSILGNATAMPIYVSASAKGGLAHKDAEIGLARACQTHDVVQMVPHLGTKSIDDCAAVRQQNQAQFVQIYVESDRNATEALVKQMEACGFAGLFVTVDSSGTGKRELDLRSTPGGSAPKTNNNLDGSNASKPTIKKRRWASDMTWDDIAWFRSITKMPIVLKGIQTGEDALLAYHHGVDGIVVSNHGGRQVDTARPSLECLVEVMAALRTVEVSHECHLHSVQCVPAWCTTMTNRFGTWRMYSRRSRIPANLKCSWMEASSEALMSSKLLRWEPRPLVLDVLPCTVWLRLVRPESKQHCKYCRRSCTPQCSSWELPLWPIYGKPDSRE
jgi:isopentenyl diphosphate isomerase/L-lactate dehydrogenase-like FMN-dependent dehydrogenase/cytochrome b involved in lipid metabolism/hemoglobin-like flavoprotein/DMSO/TMAO reductase YedYZ molybdopterin-dependent catalytic subunit